MPTVCCANRDCQAENDLADRQCQTCQTPLIKRYLWAMGDWIKAYQAGELLLDRYLIMGSQVVLDTLPAIGVEGPDEIPDYILPYQKLLPFRLNLPAVYDFFPSSDDAIDLSVWLLDYGPVLLNDAGKPVHDRLLPSLEAEWEFASPLQQLTWLWQLVRLWQPLQRQGAVSSLMEFDWLRVNGGQVQLQQLKLDDHQFYELKYLAAPWEPLLTNAHPAIADFCQTLWMRLKQGKIPHADHLLRVLDLGIQELAEQYEFSYKIFALTDTGPSRDHNEDACFPISETPVEGNQLGYTLAMVCDGVGGQEGGEIASQWVIEHLPVRLISKIEKQMNDPEQIRRFIQHMKEDIEEVNEQLSQRNDREKRLERERMGTTLVMTMAHFQQFFLANVGDSRCYWLTPRSCQQVTVDDDVASREVRMGMMLHRHAVELPRAGALTQAVGLGPSSNLHPIIQRLIVPTDSLFLLCSDGFCDHERVEQYWQEEFLPVLQGERSVDEAVPRLIDLANRVNGHDNVSVVLVHCQVSPSVPTPTQAEKKMSVFEISDAEEDEFGGDTELGLKAIAYPDFGGNKSAKTTTPHSEPNIPSQDPRMSTPPSEPSEPSTVAVKSKKTATPPIKLPPVTLPTPPTAGKPAGILAQFQALPQTLQWLIAGGIVLFVTIVGIMLVSQNNSNNNSAPQGGLHSSQGHG
ncbi:MAG: PP2C family serine/threonine-protein phosphatase [Synechocystis sp.]|nr:PP2C family serine/threonine-protein phosphatase [Synechocystis sp.]